MTAVAVLAVLLSVARPAALAAQDTSSVVVEQRQVVITILPPKLRVRPPRTAQVGFYAWRVDIKAGDSASFAFTADTAMRVTGLREIVRASSLRKCADVRDFSSLRCKLPMSDSVTVRGEGLRMFVRDSAIVALMWKTKPSGIWASTFEPNGQFRVDWLPVRYAEADSAVVQRPSRNPE